MSIYLLIFVGIPLLILILIMIIDIIRTKKKEKKENEREYIGVVFKENEKIIDDKGVIVNKEKPEKEITMHEKYDKLDLAKKAKMDEIVDYINLFNEIKFIEKKRCYEFRLQSIVIARISIKRGTIFVDIIGYKNPLQEIYKDRNIVFKGPLIRVETYEDVDKVKKLLKKTLDVFRVGEKEVKNNVSKISKQES